MTFYTYMTRKYMGEISPKGDLARDMKEDKEDFLRNHPGKYKGWHDILRHYLESHKACSDCIDIFEESWKEYEKCEKSRRSKNL